MAIDIGMMPVHVATPFPTQILNAAVAASLCTLVNQRRMIRRDVSGESRAAGMTIDYGSRATLELDVR